MSFRAFLGRIEFRSRR